MFVNRLATAPLTTVPRMKSTSLVLPFLALAVGAASAASAGCSTSNDASPPTSTPARDAAVDAPMVEGDAADAAPASSCAPPPAASKCKKEGSWVRGVAYFDPAHFGAGAKPILRIALRHEFALVDGEDAIGGRLHTFKSIPIKDPSSGRVPFAFDMCATGTAMWSEENGAFNLILHLDENANNDLAKAMSNEQAITLATPDKGELVKRTSLELSCHAPSPCVDVTLDCSDGASCTKISPIESCQAKTPGCPSDDAFCR